MTRSLYLVAFLGFFCLLSSAQFLSIENEDLLNPAELEFTNEEISDIDQQIASNTPEEIGDAISQNVAKIFQLLMEGAADSSEAQAENDEDPLDQAGDEFFANLLRAIAGHSTVIGDAVASFVVEGIHSFEDAQANGEDVGVAVGASVADIIGHINSEAQLIGETLQEDINEYLGDLETALQDSENPSEEDILAIEVLEGFGGAVERFINSLSGHAQALGDIVAKAVDDGVAAGGNDDAKIIGATFASLLQGIANDAAHVGDAMAQAVVAALTGINGITQAEIDQSSEEVKAFMVETFQSLGGNDASDTGNFITLLIEGAAVVGFHGEGPAKDVVDVINRIGDLYYQGFKDGLSR